MGFRFRKSKKIGPFRFTVSPRGISSSVGGKFFRVSGSSRGVSAGVKAPGTGLSYNQRIAPPTALNNAHTKESGMDPQAGAQEGTIRNELIRVENLAAPPKPFTPDKAYVVKFYAGLTVLTALLGWVVSGLLDDGPGFFAVLFMLLFMFSLLAYVAFPVYVVFNSLLMPRYRKNLAEHLLIKENHEARARDIDETYGDGSYERLKAGQVRVGDVEEFIIMMYGEPSDVDQTVTQKKVTRVLKYGQYAKNRYKVRITLEGEEGSGVVTKYDLK